LLNTLGIRRHVRIEIRSACLVTGARIAQSIKQQVTDYTAEKLVFDSRHPQEIRFSPQQPVSSPIGIGWYFSEVNRAA
jgi:hypothetical protein